MPDRWFIELRYEERMGKTVNLKNPRTVAEKMMWLKLHDHNPIYTIFADKYQSKIWFKEHFGELYIIPNLAIYKSVDEININELPNQFVIKCNHDSGSAFLCYDRQNFQFVDKNGVKCEWNYIVNYLRKALLENYFFYDREWPYKNIKEHLILVEPLCLTKEGNLPNDIKMFFCNGEFWFTNVTYWNAGEQDRCTYDVNWERMPFVYTNPTLYNERTNTSNVPCPPHYKEMLKIGKEIASYCKFVRVDFYDIDGEMKYGEITFYNGGGLDRFYPEEYDLFYGNKLVLK